MTAAGADPPYRLVRGAAPAAAAPELDPWQRAVVAHRAGAMLVLGGPGTGKTTTLVEAVAERIAAGASPEQVLVLTYSRRAAAELRLRIAARIGRTIREPLARTVHSYAFGVLRRRHGRIRLLTGAEQDLLIRELLRGDVAAGAPDWPVELRPALLTRGFAEELRDLLLRATERGVEPAGLAELGARYGRPDWIAAARFYRQYLQVTTLADASAYDPAELVGAAVSALTGNAELLAEERRERRHIFVDEYQDVDPAQAELIHLLAAGGGELVAFGDPDQSIYSFRGADPRCLSRFPEVAARPGAAVELVVLQRGRRGGAALHEATRRIAARLPATPLRAPGAPAGELRALRGEPDQPQGQVQVRLLGSASEEAAMVAHQLRVAHLLHGVPWRRMAVLLRSAGPRLAAVRRALAAAGIPVTATVTDAPLGTSSGSAPLLLLLRCALLPALLDEATAVELLTGALGGADPLRLRRLRQHLRQLELAAGGRRPSGVLLVEALTEPEVLQPLPPEVAAPARHVATLIRIARQAHQAGATAEEVLWEVWSASGLSELWQRASRKGGAAGAAADRDLDAVVALFDTAAAFVDRLPGSGTPAFLEYLAGQEIPADTLADRTPEGDAVRVLTAHAAKGLEWEVVCVAGVQEGRWPDLRRRGTLLGVAELVDLARPGGGAAVPPRLVAPSLAFAGAAGAAALPAGTGGDAVAALLADERRLFYVAVTRASRQLLVTAVADAEELPSRFLDELLGVTDGAPVRAPEPVPRSLTLSGLVGELRAAVCDPEQPEARRAAAATELARLARAGVRGADPEQWYGLGPLSDPAPLYGPEEQVRVSPSQVEKFTGCPLRWLAETAGAASTPSGAQAIGTLVHELATLTAQPDLATREALLPRLEAALEQLDLGSPWHTRRERRRAREMVEKFLRWLAVSRGRWELVGVEVPFQAELGPRVVLAGQVDRLERDPQGRLVVLDLKTGRSAATKAQASEHPQLGCYQLAVTAGVFDEAGTAAAPAAEAGGAALVHLGSDSAEAVVRDQPALVDADDPRWAHHLVAAVADGMASASFPARPAAGCRSCPVRTSCPGWEEGRQVTG